MDSDSINHPGRRPGWRWWPFLLLGLVVPWAVTAADTRPYQSEGTRRMAERLADLSRRANPLRHPFLNDRRVAIYGDRLAGSLPPAERLDVQLHYAQELLNAGRSEEAAAAFDQYERLGGELGAPSYQTNRFLARLYLATCWLRLGEQENCIAHHTTESCLIPIASAGVHRLPRGSRKAIQVLEPLAREHPRELSARWLLNLAYMTLGEYPQGVPADLRIDPARLASEAPFPRFPDVAAAVGLDVNELSGGAAVDDFNGDGWLDVMMTSIGLGDPMHLFWNGGDGTFREGAVAAGLGGLVGGLNLVTADYNNDGHTDVLVLRGGWMGREGRLPKSLLRNNGNGTFDDVTEAAGLLTLRPTQTAAWLDYDGDGWLDLMVGNESQGRDANPCELWHNRRDGTFADVTGTCGLGFTAFVKGVHAGDYDNDGRPDLYLSILGEPNRLLHNDGPAGPGAAPGAWRFTDRAASVGVTEPIHSFPAWFFDYDNDGHLDLFVGGYRTFDVGDTMADLLALPSNSERARLYRNRGDGTFANVSREAGLDRVLHAMGSNFGDLDNDGWLDLYLGTGDPVLSTLIPNRLFWNERGRVFRDVTTAAGMGHIQKGHAVAFADIDNDGDQDVYEDMGGAYSGDIYRNVLYANPGWSTNRWVTLKLEGVKANRAAIGARIRVVVETPGGTRSIYKTVGSGGSFGASPLRQEIGLGDARRIERVEIRWPAPGGTQVVTNVQPGAFWRIREGASGAEPWPRRSFQLPAGR